MADTAQTAETSAPPLPEENVPAAPIAQSERIILLDVLRGFAVMAIFIVNIKAMTMPQAYYLNAALWASDLDTTIALAQRVFVDDKWRTIFTALFGAGLVVMWERGAESSLMRRRMWFLLLFGAIHLTFIWYGDILLAYAMVGFLAMTFRHRRTSTLSVWGAVFIILGGAWYALIFSIPAFSEVAATKMGPEMWGTDAEKLAKEVATMSGGFLQQTGMRAIMLVATPLIVLFAGMGSLTLGIMLMGMALYKGGFLKGQCSAITYLIVVVVFLGAAWALDLFQIAYERADNFSLEARGATFGLSVIDGPLGAVGYAGLIAFLVKLGIKFSPVAAVGRMAFTNYILSSVIGTTIAGGHLIGFGLFGEVSLQFLMIVVGISFVGMLIWSPLWLSVFRFGPLEWLWRSLTYGERQPLLKR